MLTNQGTVRADKPFLTDIKTLRERSANTETRSNGRGYRAV